MSDFKDHFSKQSAIYAKFRPHYSDELFSFLSAQAADRHLAWDCGCGNGQAALGLTKHFTNIFATDPSEQQIASSFSHKKINYKVEKAERTSLLEKSVDLITVANALHWFKFEEFYQEVDRVLKPGGVIAAWTYAVPQIDPVIDKIILRLHDEILGDYWLYENKLVIRGYQDIPFPYSKMPCPAFTSKRTMDLDDLTGYLNTWSATQTFIRKNYRNPVEEILPALKKEWKEPDSKKEMTWAITLLAGKNS